MPASRRPSVGRAGLRGADGQRDARTEREDDGGEEKQPGNQGAERHVVHGDQDQRADERPRPARQRQPDCAPPQAGDFPAVGGRAGQRADGERDGARRVGGDRRQPGSDERREGKKRAAAGDGVQCPRKEAGAGENDEIDEGHGCGSGCGLLARLPQPGKPGTRLACGIFLGYQPSTAPKRMCICATTSKHGFGIVAPRQAPDRCALTKEQADERHPADRAGRDGRHQPKARASGFSSRATRCACMCGSPRAPAPACRPMRAW